MKTKMTDEQWILQNKSDHIRARETIEEIVCACYLNLFLNEQGLYDKNFTTMNDDDYVEYTALLEKIQNTKYKI